MRYANGLFSCPRNCRPPPMNAMSARRYGHYACLTSRPRFEEVRALITRPLRSRARPMEASCWPLRTPDDPVNAAYSFRISLTLSRVFPEMNSISLLNFSFAICSRSSYIGPSARESRWCYCNCKPTGSLDNPVGSKRMKIVACDLHTRYQQVTMMDEAEPGNRRNAPID